MKITTQVVFREIAWLIVLSFFAFLIVKILCVDVRGAPLTNKPTVVAIPPLPSTNAVKSAIVRSPLVTGSSLKTVVIGWDFDTNALVWNLYSMGANNVRIGITTTNQIAVTGIDITVTNNFAVTASNLVGESDFSKVLSISSPSAPNQLHILQITP